LDRLGEQLHTKALKSSRLGHQGVLTTLYSYGDEPDYRQAELLKKLAKPSTDTTLDMQIMFETMLKKALQPPLYKQIWHIEVIW